jgi:hypothetical protein
MDQSAALGGLMMLVIAVLWVVVFIPSWYQNRVDKEHNARESSILKSKVREIKNSATAPVGSKLRLATERSRKLSRTKNVMSAMAALALLGSASIAFFALQNPIFFVASGFGLLVGLFALLVAIKASSETRRLQIQVARSQTEQTINLSKSWREAILPSIGAEVDPRAWTPNPLPSPEYKSRIGELEIPIVASVTEINASGKNFDTQDEINKILRKRRASA